MESSFIVSAPGKVILFGEHSAVYHRPAIAAALGLRAYLLVSPQPPHQQNSISLELPDIDLAHSWQLSDIPWEDVAPYIPRVRGKPVVTESLTSEIVDKLEPLWSQVDGNLHRTACKCFLYLYVHLCNPKTVSCTFATRLTLPIGAGLGSLASISVCLAAALLRLGGHITDPTLTLDGTEQSSRECTHFIDRWSLVGEMCFHGNPSGIDNAVATYGGAILYQKSLNPSEPALRQNFSAFPPIQLLLANTKVARSTASLVAEVARLNNNYPSVMKLMLEVMTNIAVEAIGPLTSTPFDDAARRKLLDLVKVNHGVLQAIGVSHPSLEKIKMIADSHSIGATKLTGAGGGGCAITLIDQNVSQAKLDLVTQELRAEGFEIFSASLGGKGAGCICDVKVTVDMFRNYANREEIEASIGPNLLKGWKFW